LGIEQTAFNCLVKCIIWQWFAASVPTEEERSVVATPPDHRERSVATTPPDKSEGEWTPLLMLMMSRTGTALASSYSKLRCNCGLRRRPNQLFIYFGTVSPEVENLTGPNCGSGSDKWRDQHSIRSSQTAARSPFPGRTDQMKPQVWHHLKCVTKKPLVWHCPRKLPTYNLYRLCTSVVIHH